MTLKVFTVYDSKADAYLPPMFLPTKGLAIRSFSDAANSEGHNFHKYAGDFTLFEIGEYDDSNAMVTLLESKVNLGTALEHSDTHKETLRTLPPMEKQEEGLKHVSN